MGYVVKRANGRYQARWTQPDGQRRSRTFGRKIDAQQHLVGVEGDMLRGAYHDPSAGRSTFGEYASAWAAAQVWRDQTRASTESTLRRHLLPQWGDRPLMSIRPTEVQSWVSFLSTSAREVGGEQVGYAPATVKRAVHLFGQILAAAVEDRAISSSPARRVRVPKVNRKVIDPITVEQVAALRDAMPEHLRVAVTLGAGVGLRWSEAAGLTVDRIDFMRGRATIDRQLVPPKGGAIVWGPPKTQSSNRVIPVPRFVVDEINLHLQAHGPGPKGLIVAHKGGPCRRQAFHHYWVAAREAAGLPDARFHDLRHHCASLLIHAGASVKIVQSQLGHASAAETLDTYTHLWPTDDDVVRSAIDAAWSASI